MLCSAQAWQHSPGVCVWGYTWGDKKLIEISSTEWDRTALAHEIAHVAGGAITHDTGHCRWGDRRFRSMIEMLEGEPDGNRPEKSCSP